MGCGAQQLKTWQQWEATSGELNRSAQYSYDGYDFRTWYPEVTVMKGSAGMLVSCKIDAIRAGYDDHMVVLVGFGATPDAPQADFAQVSVQFLNASDETDYQNIFGAPIYNSADASISDFGEATYDTLSQQLDAMDFGSASNNTARQKLADIARMNVNALILAAINS